MDPNRRRHDIVGALRSLRFLADALDRGYRFDDEAADEKIRRIREAVAVLEREEKILIDALESAIAQTD